MVSGGLVSTVIVRVSDGLEVLPAISVALAVYGCTPSATPVRETVQVPAASVAAEPTEFPSSKISTPDPGSAVPASVIAAPEVVSTGGFVIAGGAGTVRSIVHP